MNFESIRQHQRVFSIFAAVVVVLFALAMFFIQQALDTSQDLRQQASVDSGQVEVTMLPLQVDQVQLNQPSYIDLGINTNNLQTNGVQLSFSLSGAVSNFSFEPLSGSGFSQPLVNSAIGGNAGEVAFFPSDITGSFSSSVPVPFMRINFTPTSAGDVTLSFDAVTSQSTIHNSNPPQDELNTIEPIVIAVAAPSPTPSPSPTPTLEPSPSLSPTPSPSPSPSPTPSSTPSPAPTVDPSPTPLASPSPSPVASSPTPSPLASATVQPEPSPTPETCPNNPDLNNDTRVDLLDYNMLAANFMQSGENIDGDINCSGTVDLADYSLLSNAFSLL